MTTVDEVNIDKTKVPDDFTVRSVLLHCFTAELVNDQCKFTCKRLTYSWLARDVIIFQNPKLKSHQSFYPYQAL